MRQPGERVDEQGSVAAPFLREHRNIDLLLSLLHVELGALASDGAPRYVLMVDVLHYLTSYVDHYHHGREDLLFAAAARRAPGLEPFVTAVEEQHGDVIGSGAMLRGDLERALLDLPVPKSHLLEAGRAYVRGLRAHLDYEEREVFPRVAAVLGPEDIRAVDALFGTVRDPLFGPVTHERYRSLFDEVSRTAGCDCRFV